MERICDLHVHSTFSDGTLTPEQLICEAERCGLSALALCDHNTVAGLPDFLAAAEGKSVEAVPGIEFSTDYNGIELHILGLFIRPEHYETITTMLEDFRRLKDQSNRDLVEALSAAGYVLDYDVIKSATPNGQVNRAHIAAALLAHGYVESSKDAFKRLLAPKHGFYKPPQRLNALDCIRFIKSLGCAVVWAHPFSSMDGEEEVREFLKEAVPCGLGGMETLYSTYDEKQTRAAASLAEEFGLKQSGGSDFHGANKPDISMGTGRGNLHIPFALVQELKLAL